jgi:pimeloyl-ACP methyl ester carboxylesterase
MALIDVDGRQVEYKLEGSGDLIVLLAASWWPMDTWDLSGFPQLAGEYQVLTFNNRGIGASAATPQPYTCASLAGDAVALIDALGLRQPAHVVGFANGSGVAIKVALQHPHRVRSLILAASSPGTPASAPAPSIRERQHIEHQGFREFIRNHALNDTFAFTPATYANHRERATALADALWEHQGTEAEFLKHADARQGYSAVDDARGISVPVLVLCGAEDNVERGPSTPVRTSHALADAFPNARLHLIPGVAHMTFWEDPDAAWAPVREFLRSVG